MKSLKVLTLNAGLLEVEILGHTVFESAPFENERLAALPQALINTHADVIALQEVYEQKHRMFLIEKLHDVYPHHFYSRQHRRFRLDNSLIFFSKHHIVQRKVLTFTDSVLEERLLVRKGVLIAKIEAGEFGLVTFYNFHTVSGGIRNPQNEEVERVRAEQIGQMIHRIEKTRGHDIKIILGDLNAGPETAKENYDMFSQFHYIDVVTLKHSSSYSKKTWNPDNALNRTGHYKRCPPQRCDHIFIRERDLKRIQVESADVVLDAPIVQVSGADSVTVSDHAGVLAEVSRI